MSKTLSLEEMETGSALIEYWNILTGKESNTPQNFSKETSNVKCGIGRTLEFKSKYDITDLENKAILFKKATDNDVTNRDVGNWSSLNVTGPVTSLRYTTKGIDLPDITTRVSAEGKTIDQVNDEISIVYETLKGLKTYFDDADLNENTPIVDAFRKFATHQYGVEYLESLDYSSKLDDTHLNVKWNDDSKAHAKRYDVAHDGDGSTKYLKLTIRTPRDIQYPTEQTTCMLRISDKSSFDKFKTILGEHLEKLEPVYQAAISGNIDV
ncbi:hypothetical protein GQ473_00915 [archaeon]|nr:hypothetical protein [archaeon]